MSETTHEFKRALGLFDGTMLVIGSMIGSGIFIVSADIARTVGGGGWVLAIWVITGLMTVTGALAYGELAGMMPHAGGQYVYLREAYNPLVGFLYGWTLFLVIQTGTIAAVGVAFAKFTAVLFPGLGEANVLLEAGPVRLTAQRLVAILNVAVLTFINTRGIVGGKRIERLHDRQDDSARRAHRHGDRRGSLPGSLPAEPGIFLERGHHPRGRGRRVRGTDHRPRPARGDRRGHGRLALLERRLE